MTRRFLLKLVTACGVSALLPKTLLASAEATSSPLPVSAILRLAFEAARGHYLAGTHWASEALRAKETDGQLRVGLLGPLVIDGRTGVAYEPEQIATWIFWTQEEERKLITTAQRVSFVERLLTHAFDAHNFAILEHIGPYRTVASKEYRYRLGTTMQVGDGMQNVVQMYTALATFGGSAPTYTRGK